MIKEQHLENLCPLCGKSNACQQAANKLNQQGMSNEPCWCMSIKLSESSKQLIKEQTTAKRCLCQSCIQKISQAQQ